MKYIYSTLRRAAVHRRVWQQQRHQHRPRRSKRTPRPPQVQRRGVPVPVRSVSPVQSTDFVPLAWSSGRLKKRAFDEMLSGDGFGAETPTETVLLCCLTKLCIMPPSMAVKRRRFNAAGSGWKCGRNHDQVLGVSTGRRMAQPEAGRRSLRLRAMPPGRLRRKRQNPHPAAVTTIELTPADVCADCGARLLEEREVKDRA